MVSNTPGEFIPKPTLKDPLGGDTANSVREPDAPSEHTHTLLPPLLFPAKEHQGPAQMEAGPIQGQGGMTHPTPGTRSGGHSGEISHLAWIKPALIKITSESRDAFHPNTAGKFLENLVSSTIALYFLENSLGYCRAGAVICSWFP